jgi:hypothetical protein
LLLRAVPVAVVLTPTSPMAVVARVAIELLPGFPVVAQALSLPFL